MEQTHPLVETLYSVAGGKEVGLIAQLEKCTQCSAEILSLDEVPVVGRRGEALQPHSYLFTLFLNLSSS